MCIFEDEFESILNEIARLEKKCDRLHNELRKEFEDYSRFDKEEE